MNITNHTESPYFERLPRSARPALQAAWDKAYGKQFGTLAIYQSFCRDMDQIGIDKPSRPVMTDWIYRVQEGQVARPGSQADGADPVAVANLEAVLAERIEEIVEEPVDLEADTPAEAAIPTESHPLEFQFNSDVLKLFADSGKAAPAVADALAEARTNLRKELKVTCLDAVDDITDAVVTRAQTIAREMMIEILRELVAEMEAAA